LGGAREKSDVSSPSSFCRLASPARLCTWSDLRGKGGRCRAIGYRPARAIRRDHGAPLRAGSPHACMHLPPGAEAVSFLSPY